MNAGDSPTSFICQVANSLSSGGDEPPQQAQRRKPVDPPKSLPSLRLGRSRANAEQHVQAAERPAERPIERHETAQDANVAWIEELVGVNNGNSESFSRNPLGGIVIVGEPEEYSEVTPTKPQAQKAVYDDAVSLFFTERNEAAASPFRSLVKEPMQLFEPRSATADDSAFATKIAMLEKELEEARCELKSAEKEKKELQDELQDMEVHMKAETAKPKKEQLSSKLPTSAFVEINDCEEDDHNSIPALEEGGGC